MNTGSVSQLNQKLQHKMITVLEKADGKNKFALDRWEKPVGKGINTVLKNGNIIEKASVNFSLV